MSVVKEVFHGPVDTAAQKLGLSQGDKEILSSPENELTTRFTVPIDSREVLFEGYRVIHNTARGPGKGGIRYDPAVTLSEVRRLAAWMTWKTAIADLPFGGAKGGVTVDPLSISEDVLYELTRRYTRGIAPIIGATTDVPAPDVGTSPTVMEWILAEYARIYPEKRTKKELLAVVTGKPIESGGLEGRAEATGFGVAAITRLAAEKLGMNLTDQRIIIEGFGNVGFWTAKFLHEQGARISGVSDKYGGIYYREGLDMEKVLAYAQERKSLDNYPGLVADLSTGILTEDCDILIPAAREDQITLDNAGQIKAKLIVEGANGPVTPEADIILNQNEVVIIPDVLANSSGVTASYLEWLQNRRGITYSKKQVFDYLQKSMERSFNALWDIHKTEQQDLRTAAYLRALKKVLKAEEERQRTFKSL